MIVTVYFTFICYKGTFPLSLYKNLSNIKHLISEIGSQNLVSICMTMYDYSISPASVH